MRGEHWKTAGMLLAIAGMLLVGMAVQRARCSPRDGEEAAIDVERLPIDVVAGA